MTNVLNVLLDQRGNMKKTYRPKGKVQFNERRNDTSDLTGRNKSVFNRLANAFLLTPTKSCSPMRSISLFLSGACATHDVHYRLYRNEDKFSHFVSVAALKVTCVFH